MTVRRIYVAGELLEVSGAGYAPSGSFLKDGVEIAPGAALRELLTAAALASDAQLVELAEGRWEIRGDPTEGALVVAAAKADIDKGKLDERYPRLDEIPFSSERKRMTTLHRTPAGTVACAKGGVEVILGACARQRTATAEEPLDDVEREAILTVAAAMAADALRVLAVARKADASREGAEQEMTFLGLAGLSDPPRPEARAAVATCRQAGIRPMMITGDHPATATAVARELGLLREGRVITGAELEAMDDAELAEAVTEIEVCARVSPAHKLRLVEALQRRGEIVAMTGDGVNDAPALKKADIGIAMGIAGTEVSREAAAMTLTDDNFASIVAAVEEGRGIFANIKKYLMYLLSSNIGEIGLIAAATLAGLPLPLSAVQLLYVNLATDGLPALALAVDPAADDLMRRPPRDPRRGIFTRPVVVLMVAGGLWSATVNLALFLWGMRNCGCIEEAMTMTFVSLVLIQFFKTYNFRSDRRSVLHRPFANHWLNLAILWELALLTLVVYLPALHRPFTTFSLPARDLAIVAAVSFSICPVLELVKWMARRGWFDPDG